MNQEHKIKSKLSAYQWFCQRPQQMHFEELGWIANSCQRILSPESKSSIPSLKESSDSIRNTSGDLSRHQIQKLVAISSKGIRIGEDSPVAKYTDHEIDTVIRLRNEGYSYACVARMMDMPKSTVWAIVQGLMRGVVVDRWEKRKCKS